MIEIGTNLKQVIETVVGLFISILWVYFILN